MGGAAVRTNQGSHRHRSSRGSRRARDGAIGDRGSRLVVEPASERKLPRLSPYEADRLVRHQRLRSAASHGTINGRRGGAGLEDETISVPPRLPAAVLLLPKAQHRNGGGTPPSKSHKRGIDRVSADPVGVPGPTLDGTFGNRYGTTSGLRGELGTGEHAPTFG